MQIGRGGFNMLPPVVKNLLIINILMFLATWTFQVSMNIDLRDLLGLHYFDSEKFHPYQIVSYMFMHGDLTHLFFNMFAVWMFGNAIENVWGSKRFLVYYILTGFGAAFLHYAILYFEMLPDLNQIEAIIVNPTYDAILAFSQEHQYRVHPMYYPQIFETYERFSDALGVLASDPSNQAAIDTSRNFFIAYLEHYKNLPNVVGASGSLFGILLAFGMMFPNVSLYLLFLPIPIKAKYFVMGYGAIELYSAFQNNPGDNVAHFAHLGGMLFGFIIIKIWQKTGSRWR